MSPDSKKRLKKKTMSCYVTPEQYDQLQLLSARTRIPMSVILREGIDMVIDVYNRRLADDD